MPRFLLSALISLAYTLIFAYSGTIAHPYAYRHKWYPERWRPTPYTGKTSRPLQDSAEQLKRCRQLCESTALQLRQQLRDGAQTLEIITPGPYTRCPLTGLDYRVVQWQDYVVVCPGHPHNKSVFWDSRCEQLLDNWRTPSTLDDEGRFQDLLLHAWTAYYCGDFSQALILCEKIHEGNRSEAEGLQINLYLALGQPDKGLKLFEQAKNRQELRPNQCNCLLEMGRFQEVLKSEPTAVQKCMAEMWLERKEEAAKTLESLKKEPLFEAFALMAFKRYPECRKKCEEVIRDEGWQADYAGNAVLLGVLSDWLSGAPETQTRTFLQKGLNEAPKSWPYPLMRYLNRELCEQEVLEIAGGDLSHQVEAKFTVGLTLLAQKRDTGHGRDLLTQAAAHGQYFEAMVAHSLL